MRVRPHRSVLRYEGAAVEPKDGADGHIEDFCGPVLEGAKKLSYNATHANDAAMLQRLSE
jgi:hypothetical protein